MTNNTLFIGLALLALGIFAYMEAGKEAKAEAEAATVEARKTDPKAAEVEAKKVSPTALIPSGFGVVMLLCVAGIVFKPGLRKHIMHAAAVVGVLGFLGGFMPVMRAGSLDFNKSSVRTGLIMALICTIFVGLCVKSFIDARKARQATA
jgi:hypothetical protein